MSVLDDLNAMRAAGYVPPDGFGRSLESERRLNAAAAETFDSPAGREVLAWLHQITTLRFVPDDTPADGLRALNAQRNLVKIITDRIDYGRRSLPSSPE